MSKPRSLEDLPLEKLKEEVKKIEKLFKEKIKK